MSREVWNEAVERVQAGESVNFVANALGLAEATLRYRAKGRPQAVAGAPFLS